MNKLIKYMQSQKHIQRSLVIIITFICVFLGLQVSAFAFTNSNNNNLPPYASLDLSKSRMIDVNITNDGTTGVNSSDLKSSLNSILKPKLAKEGISFKINVADVGYEDIYEGTTMNIEDRPWEQVYASKVYEEYQSDSNAENYDYYFVIQDGNLYELEEEGDSDEVHSLDLTYTIDRDTSKYTYRVVIYKGSSKTSLSVQTAELITKEGTSLLKCGKTRDKWYQYVIQRAPILDSDNTPIKTISYASTNDYTMCADDEEDFDFNDTLQSGISGTINYQIKPSNKIYLTYDTAFTGHANIYTCRISYYSDYNMTKYNGSAEVFDYCDVRLNKNDPDEYQSGDVILSFPANTVAFSLSVSADYVHKISFGNNWEVGLYKNGNVDEGSLELNDIATAYIQRPAFISENLDNSAFTWRADSEKYIVSLSNFRHAENMYGEGKARTLSALMNDDIISVKISSSSLKSDAEQLINDNDNNGRFIPYTNTDAVITDLTNYVINRTKATVDMVSDFKLLSKDTIDSTLKSKLSSNYIDLKYSSSEAKVRDPNVYPQDRFYFATRKTNDADSIYYIWYYDETNHKFVQTTQASNLYTSFITPRGTLLSYNYNNISNYIPIDNDIQIGISMNFGSGGAYAQSYSVPYRKGGKTKYQTGRYSVQSISVINNNEVEALLQGYCDDDEYYFYSTMIINYVTGAIVSGATPYVVDTPPSIPSIATGQTNPFYEGYKSYEDPMKLIWTNNIGSYTILDKTITAPDGNSFKFGWYAVTGPTVYYTPQMELYLASTIDTSGCMSNIPDMVSENSNNYVSYIGTENLASISTANKTTLLSKITGNAAKFVGIGTSASKATIDSLIASNSGKGKYIAHSNTTTDLIALADYIISTTVKPSEKLIENYIVVSENEEDVAFESGGINATTGIQQTDATSIRSKEYLSVESDGNYTVSDNGTGITSAKVYCYNSSLALISSMTVAVADRFTLPADTSCVKLSCTSTNPANILTLVDNLGSGGDTINYKPSVTDEENDSADVVYKFDHDPLKIANVIITNPMDKIALSGTELSAPIQKFTKAGTYKISMYAKDIPKDKADTTNLLPNGNAETVDLSDWSTNAALPSTTIFTRRTTADYKIAGNGSFEISTPHYANGTNNQAYYYKDLAVSSNTTYTLSGLITALRCSGYFTIYELDDYNNILNTVNSPNVTNGIAQSSSVAFTTGLSTIKIRVHIMKGLSTTETSSLRDYVFADSITLVKMLPNTLFDSYRKTSITADNTIYAHRLPRANFSYQISNTSDNFNIKSLADNQLSYDPDHTDKTNKGIINSQWRYAVVESNGSTIWYEGKVPEAATFISGQQVIIWYRVQDSDGPGGIGAWSLPKVIKTDGDLSNPVAAFVPSPNPLPIQNTLTIADQSYSTNYGGTITARAWTIQKNGTSQTLTFDSSNTTTQKYYKSFAGLGFGKYTIGLTVTDSFGKASKPYSQTITVIDTLNPTVSASPSSGTFTGDGGTAVTLICKDSTTSTAYNRGLKTIFYAWSKNTTAPQSTDTLHYLEIATEGTYTKSLTTTTPTTDGTWYLYVKDIDYAGNTNNGDGSYTRFGPYTIETLKASHFYITMMFDIGWRSYYFDVDNGIDDDHDGENDRYPRRAGTDIGTLKMPINYLNLVGYEKTYIKAGYKVKGKIDIVGKPDWAEFHINYIKGGRIYTDTVSLTKTAGETYVFEWIIPLETDTKTFVSFDLLTQKGDMTYGNEKWVDTWDARNTSRSVFYVKGKATDDLAYVQSH